MLRGWRDCRDLRLQNPLVLISPRVTLYQTTERRMECWKQKASDLGTMMPIVMVRSLVGIAQTGLSLTPHSKLLVLVLLTFMNVQVVDLVQMLLKLTPLTKVRLPVPPCLCCNNSLNGANSQIIQSIVRYLQQLQCFQKEQLVLAVVLVL